MIPRMPPMAPRTVTTTPYTRQKYEGMQWICTHHDTPLEATLQDPGEIVWWMPLCSRDEALHDGTRLQECRDFVPARDPYSEAIASEILKGTSSRSEQAPKSVAVECSHASSDSGTEDRPRWQGRHTYVGHSGALEHQPHEGWQPEGGGSGGQSTHETQQVAEERQSHRHECDHCKIAQAKHQPEGTGLVEGLLLTP